MVGLGSLQYAGDQKCQQETEEIDGDDTVGGGYSME